MSKVYFIKEITKENVIKAYNALNIKLNGNVAIKVHSGEEGNQNYLRPEFMEPMIKYLNGTVVECNTAYEGSRNTTDKHEKLMEQHNWNKYFNVDIMDSEKNDLILDIKNGKVIKKNYVGNHLKNYDSMLVLSHFKGHPMGGYGGALKQLSIGCASSYGKSYIHGAGDANKIWTADHDKFLEAMADAASSVYNYFKGNIAFINVMCNLSVDCDCCSKADDPCMNDIGILSSTDPVALDQACLDLIYQSNDKGKEKFIERVESRNGAHTIEMASALSIGSREYELIIIEK